MTQILLHSVIKESNLYHYEANHYFMRVEITIFLLLPTSDNYRELSTSLPSMLGTFWIARELSS